MAVTVECDLRSQFGPVRDQGARPTCVAFAASDAHAAVRPDWVPLSSEFAYFHAVKRDGGDPRAGVSVAGMLAAIKEDGQPPESVWAYLPDLPGDLALWAPPANADPLYRRGSSNEGASIAAIERRLDAGSAVVVAMCLSDAFYRPDAEGVIDAQEAPDPQRRHAVVVVGYGRHAGKRVFLVRNSWGANWGVDGYAWVAAEYLGPRLYGLAEMKEDLTNVLSDPGTKNVRGGVA